MNNPEMYQKVKAWFTDLVGDNYVEQEFPNTGGEDFSYFAQAVPSVFFWLGTQADDGIYVSAHNSAFTFNEKAMPMGVAAFLRIVLGYLNGM